MDSEDIYDKYISKNWENDNYRFHQKPSKTCLLECFLHEHQDHKNLMNVINNMSYMIPYCALKIYCSNKNYEKLKELEKYNKNIIIDPNIPESRTIFEYNNMMIDPNFWKSFESEKVLIFQTDSAVLQNNILKFIHYDYVGAAWPYNPTGVDDIHVGNGGFSLRNPKICSDICRVNKMDFPEDVFFAKHFHYTEYANVADMDIANQFSCETIPMINTFGMHKAYLYTPRSYIKKLFDVRHKKVKQPFIIDAFIGCEGNIIKRSQKLLDWIKLGIGPSGLYIPKDSIVPYELDKYDEYAGKKKYLGIKFYSQVEKKEEICPIMLIKNKIVQFDNLIY